MTNFLDAVRAKLRQPSTLMGIGLIVGGIVYWFTKSPSLALLAAGAIPGAVNDHTADLLKRTEAVEDGLRTANATALVTNQHLAAMRMRLPSNTEVQFGQQRNSGPGSVGGDPPKK